MQLEATERWRDTRSTHPLLLARAAMPDSGERGGYGDGSGDGGGCAYLSQLEAYDLVVLLAALGRARYRPKAPWLASYFAASSAVLPRYGPAYLLSLLRCRCLPVCS
jgi:hypothetical protein